VTGFVELERSDIVWAADVVGAPELPAHGVQLLTALITTKSYHEKSIPLRPDDYEDEPLDEQSYVLPWSVVTLNDTADVEFYLTTLTDDRIEDVTTQLVEYVS
jgi:mRNA-degrading endonuclease toxin of MazEF toxin-antitoxin module